jgi:hypothetical protein
MSAWPNARSISAWVGASGRPAAASNCAVRDEAAAGALGGAGSPGAGAGAVAQAETMANAAADEMNRMG